MNPGDLEFLKATLYDNGGLGLDLKRDCKWLQMVVPPEELQYLRVKRDDGIFEKPQNCFSKEDSDLCSASDPCRNVTSQLILSDSGVAAATGCDRGGGCRDNIFGIKCYREQLRHVVFCC